MTELSMHNQIILNRLTDDEDWILKGLRTVPILRYRIRYGGEFWDDIETLVAHKFVELRGDRPILTPMGIEVADFMIERDCTACSMANQTEDCRS